MPTVNVDRNLLFGLLALQNSLIDQDQLVDAFRAWSRDKGRSIADFLFACGDLDADERSAVQAMVGLHEKKHGGSTEKSLAAIPSGRSTRRNLAALGDSEIEKTLAHVGSALLTSEWDADADRTTTYSVGNTTSDGQRFRVLRPHARGGLGAVFVALDGELNREVALKQILDQHADDATSRARFLREAEITGSLEHPGIVPVYALGTYAGGRPYYAMRLIRGDSLKEAIAAFHGDETLRHDHGASSLALRNLLRRFTDVCNAIEYAHSRGVLHRDIKPSNVVLGKHGETLVVDWGLAKATGRSDPCAEERTIVPSLSSGSAETLPGSALGTPAYMSPEQAEGDLDRISPLSDVYSLGATLYCLLTGKPPFDGDDLGAVLIAVQKGDFESVRTVDPRIAPALEAVCHKAIATKPQDRYSSPRALADDVERWLADEPVLAFPEKFGRRTARWMRRHRAWTQAGLAALVIVASVATFAALAINVARTNTAKALKAERLARSEAQTNFQTARSAVHDYLTTVSENTLLKQQDRTDLRVLRKELLQGALKYYQGFIAQRANEPGLQSELADAYFRVGKITSEIDSKAEALKAHEQARALRQILADARPDETRLQADVASSEHDIGVLLHETGRTAEALLSYERSQKIHERLARAEPGVADHPSAIATALTNIGVLLRDVGKPDAALQSYRKARDLRQQLVDDHPAVARFRRDLAVSHDAIGYLLYQTGKRGEALQSYEKARAIFAELVRTEPTVNLYRADLADVDLRIGHLLSTIGNPDQAVRSYERGVTAYEHLTAVNPSVSLYQRGLAYGLNNLGLTQSSTGRTDAAMLAHTRALHVRQKLVDGNPADTQNQANLAASHANIGNLEQRLGRTELALRSLERAETIYQRLADANPTATTFRRDLAVNFNNIGIIQSAIGRSGEALRSFERAQSLYRALTDANPSTPEFRSGLADCFLKIGYQQTLDGHQSEGLRSFTRAQDLYRALADAEPAVTEYQHDLAACLNNRGELLNESGQTGEAFQCSQQALAIRLRLAETNPTVTSFQSNLAESYNTLAQIHRKTGNLAEAIQSSLRAQTIFQSLTGANLTSDEFVGDLGRSLFNTALLQRASGDTAGALNSFEQAVTVLRKKKRLNADEMYGEACALAQIYALVGPGERAMIAGDGSVRLLRQALAAGFRDTKSLRESHDLDPLRSRPDFRLLMMDLAMPSDPFVSPDSLINNRTR
jgi:eukaryotic-like serine/threonine-protein kinase